MGALHHVKIVLLSFCEAFLKTISCHVLPFLRLSKDSDDHDFHRDHQSEQRNNDQNNHNHDHQNEQQNSAKSLECPKQQNPAIFAATYQT